MKERRDKQESPTNIEITVGDDDALTSVSSVFNRPTIIRLTTIYLTEVQVGACSLEKESRSF